jgi:hypothetical protein
MVQPAAAVDADQGSGLRYLDTQASSRFRGRDCVLRVSSGPGVPMGEEAAAPAWPVALGDHRLAPGIRIQS